jgi:hypothetical protein
MDSRSSVNWQSIRSWQCRFYRRQDCSLDCSTGCLIRCVRFPRLPAFELGEIEVEDLQERKVHDDRREWEYHASRFTD